MPAVTIPLLLNRTLAKATALAKVEDSHAYDPFAPSRLTFTRCCYNIRSSQTAVKLSNNPPVRQYKQTSIIRITRSLQNMRFDEIFYLTAKALYFQFFCFFKHVFLSQKPVLGWTVLKYRAFGRYPDVYCTWYSNILLK